MIEEFLNDLRALELDALTLKQAVEVRASLKEALVRFDGWFAGHLAGFDMAVKVAKEPAGRPPETAPRTTPVARGESHPVKASPRRRGRPVPNLKVEFKKRPAPLVVGGANAETGAGPAPAQIFQDSYVSKEGPQPGARLPPDHPRNMGNRVSSVTPEVDMSDFHEAEEALRKGQLAKVFQ